LRLLAADKMGLIAAYFPEIASFRAEFNHWRIKIRVPDSSAS
jgi:hypothetical protein